MIVTVAAVPFCFAGWLAWGAVDDDGEPAGRTRSAATPSGAGDATRSPREAGREGADPDSGRGDPSGSVSPRQSTNDAREADAGRPLAGKVVVLDPGHNVHNVDHPAEINRLVDIGTNRKECDTTGTATNRGYSEAEFTMDVARRVGALLDQRGAKVTYTHLGQRAWGPCVDERARIGNEAHADAAVSIHADGSTSPTARGFHVIVPAAVDAGGADTGAITGPSRRLGLELKEHYADATSLPPATYLGGGSGMTVRQDLGGLNLSKVPKVFIECGNMRNSADADLLASAAGRQRVARGIADGISGYLVG
nr:N-acetylmuramoyl-L-alanine amidase [Wenjunlia vitaminophila]